MPFSRVTALIGEYFYGAFYLQMTAAIMGISEYNRELVQKYQKEMKLRKKYHNELVELKGTYFVIHNTVSLT